MLNKDYIRVLYIDLGKQEVRVQERKDLQKDYLGGTGAASKLFDENAVYDQDALSPEQPVIFATGALASIFPVATKTISIFKSPLTGEFGESHVGARMAYGMHVAGFDALVISGKSRLPVYLSVTDCGVKFKKAEPLWGMDTIETGQYFRDLEDGKGRRSVVRIGQGGEKQIAFANVTVDTYRHFGRMGLGAVMGSKNLKGLVIYGGRSYDIPDHLWKNYLAVFNEIYNKTVKTEAMQKYHDLGTSKNINVLNTAKGLPTRNLQSAYSETASLLSGEDFAKDLLVRKIACAGCPEGCIHIGLLRTEFASGFEYKSQGFSYDYELIFALGTLLGMTDKNDVMKLIEATETYGLDSITTGIVLAWATEAKERNLITAEELQTEISFNNADGYLKMLDFLMEGKNEFYQEMAKGPWALAERYNGQDFVLTIGKNSIAGYHTGYGALIGQAVGARHSHCDNAGYDIDQKKPHIQMEELIEEIIKEETFRNIINSLSICLFARKIYDLDTIEKALLSIGLNFSQSELKEIGKRIFNLKVQIKKKLGFDYENIQISKRFYETISSTGQLSEDEVKKGCKIFSEKIAV